MPTRDINAKCENAGFSFHCQLYTAKTFYLRLRERHFIQINDFYAAVVFINTSRLMRDGRKVAAESMQMVAGRACVEMRLEIDNRA